MLNRYQNRNKSRLDIEPRDKLVERLWKVNGLDLYSAFERAYKDYNAFFNPEFFNYMKGYYYKINKDSIDVFNTSETTKFVRCVEEKRKKIGKDSAMYECGKIHKVKGFNDSELSDILKLIKEILKNQKQIKEKLQWKIPIQK